MRRLQPIGGMEPLHSLKLVVLAMFAMTLIVAAADAQGWGSRLRRLSGLTQDSSAQNAPASPPSAPSQSEPTFARSPLAPEPSVSIPAATSPAGDLSQGGDEGGWSFGSRIKSAATAAREALTIKPREVPAPDPVRLDSRPPDNVKAPVFVSAARVYEMQGRLEEAREYYEKALAAEPKHLQAQVGLARLEHREGDLVSATERYQEALRSHPGHPVALNDLGLCYARRGMLQQARQAMEKAVGKEPNSKLYRNNLALVLVEMKQPEEAMRQLQEVHGKGVAHYNMAVLLRERGHHDAAAEHLQAALRIDPRMEPARAMLAQLNPASGVDRRGRLGAPQIEGRRGDDPRRPGRGPAPVVEQQPPHRQQPVSHRQPQSANPPADVGPVRVRFENGDPSDFRRGPGGAASGAPHNAGERAAPQSQYPWGGGSRPALQRNSNPAGSAAPGRAGAGDRQHYETPRGERRPAAPQPAPGPGNLPDYMRRDAPQPRSAAPASGSRWSRPR